MMLKNEFDFSFRGVVKDDRSGEEFSIGHDQQWYVVENTFKALQADPSLVLVRFEGWDGAGYNEHAPISVKGVPTTIGKKLTEDFVTRHGPKPEKARVTLDIRTAQTFNSLSGVAKAAYGEATKSGLTSATKSRLISQIFSTLVSAGYSADEVRAAVLEAYPSLGPKPAESKK